MKLIVLLLLITYSFSSDINEYWPLKGINIEVRDKNISDQDIKNIVSTKMNLIILNLEFDLFQNEFKLDSKETIIQILEETKRIINLAKNYNIKVIVGFTNLPNIEYKETIKPNFWNKNNITNIYNLCEEIILSLYLLDETLLGYKFLDEPLIIKEKENNVPDDWINIQKSIINIIRNIDKERYIIVTSGPGGTGRNFNKFIPINDDKIIYGFHFFEPHSYTHQGINNREKGIGYPSLTNNHILLEHYMKSIISFKEKYNLPILAGSFSVVHDAEGNNKYLNDVIDIFDKYNFSWAYWCYKGYKKWDINNDFSDNNYVDKQLNSSRWKLLKNKIAQEIKEK